MFKSKVHGDFLSQCAYQYCLPKPKIIPHISTMESISFLSQKFPCIAARLHQKPYTDISEQNSFKTLIAHHISILDTSSNNRRQNKAPTSVTMVQSS